MRQVLQSLSITMIVAAALSVSVGLFSTQPIWKLFVLFVVLQFIFFAVYNNYKDYKIRIQMEQEYTNRIQAQASQTISVPCASCGVENEHVVNLTSDNDFTCDACGVDNSMYINITTAQKTTPIRSESLQIKSLIQNELDARERLQ